MILLSSATGHSIIEVYVRGLPAVSPVVTVNQKVCSSHQVKRESLVTIVTPKCGVMRTLHCLGVKYTPNLV